MKQENKTDQSTQKEEESKGVENIRHKVKTKKIYEVHRCKHCRLSFKDSYNLKRHIKQNICVRNQFKCKYCRKKFDTITEEILHVTKMNCLDCLICKTTSKSYGSFIQHRLRHTTKKKHTCAECNKSFHGSGDFQRHKIIHTGELPFKCKRCDKEF